MAIPVFKAALFDLDGVLFDTEPIYSVFWGGVCRKYRPEVPGLENLIKGQTLTQIFDGYFSELVDEQPEIVRCLNEFEANMPFIYIKGVERFLADLHKSGVLTAVVTSSNLLKMNAVYRAHPDVQQYFDRILTSEDFTESKPSPQCYLRAAEFLGADIRECVVFEDSINGLKSGMASGAVVVGLSTTNSVEKIAPLSHLVVPDFHSLGVDDIKELLIRKYQQQ